MAALLAHDGVIERGGSSTKTWLYSEDWDILILLYRREVGVLEEGKRVGPLQWEMGMT